MRPILLAACALSACSVQPADQNATNAVAVENIIVQPITPYDGPGPVTETANGATPAGEAPSVDESEEGAAAVVRSYYALLDDGKYAEAWALWENVGKASGMTAQAFAASFDKYREYHADVGAPGRIDAGAGQRFVTVPVRVFGKLKAGDRPFNMQGSLTLHRTAVDGSTLEQKSWRIRTADIKPRPEAEPTAEPSPPPLDNRSTARYKCIDGSRLTAAFDPDNAKVTITRAGKTLVLRQERVAAGIRYAAGRVSFAGTGERMTFGQPGLPPLPCSPIRR